MYPHHRCHMFLSLVTSSSLALACASGETSLSRGESIESGSSSTGTDSSGSGDEPEPPDPSGGESVDCAPLALQVEAVLDTNCADCHGPGSGGQGGMDYVTSLASLIAKKKVIPGDPEGSPLFSRMSAQQMPPGGVQPRPSVDDIEVIRQWIAAGACVTSGATNCADNSFISRDQMVDAMRDDIQDLDNEDRVFIRYLTLTHLHNAGMCDAEIEPYRLALAKLINSLSHEPLIKRPQPIDPERTIYRVDLRDYGWDDASDQLGEDLWDATAAANPYVLLLQGGALEDLTDSAGTAFPFQPADSFLHIVTQAPLYDKILLLPATIDELEASLDIDVDANFADDDLVRAGFKESGVSEFNRVIERHVIPASNSRYYYRSFDFKSSAGTSDIFSNPIDFVAAGGEYIFSLPNGMQAYVITDAAGVILPDAPIDIVSDPKQRDRTVRTAISCMSCHDRGILPKNDEIGAFVKANLTQFPDKLIRDKVEALYRPEFIEQQQADANVFAAVMANAGIPVDTPEPIVLTYLSFEADLDLRRVAGELGIDPETLKKNLALLGDLDKSLLALYEGGHISRESFSVIFQDVMCRLLVGDEVTPLCVNPA